MNSGKINVAVTVNENVAKPATLNKIIVVNKKKIKTNCSDFDNVAFLTAIVQISYNCFQTFQIYFVIFRRIVTVFNIAKLDNANK